MAFDHYVSMVLQIEHPAWLPRIMLNPTSNVIVLGVGAFGSLLGLNEVMKVEPS